MAAFLGVIAVGISIIFIASRQLLPLFLLLEWEKAGEGGHNSPLNALSSPSTGSGQARTLTGRPTPSA